MLSCPNCGAALAGRRTQTGFLFECPECKGILAGGAPLRRAGFSTQSLRELWKNACLEARLNGRCCPHCGRPMKTAALKPGFMGNLELDVCPLCQQIWFDPGEMARFPRDENADIEPEETPREFFKDAAPLEIIGTEPEIIDGEIRDYYFEDPDDPGRSLAGIFGFPVEENDEPLKSLPLITSGIALACLGVAVFAFMSGHPEKIFNEWGFIPDQWDRYFGATLITSFFLHGDIFHLLSNLYFLMIFGDNVEDSLGKIRYVLLLLAADFSGNLVHMALDPQSSIPLIGASGGISGIMAYYAVMFPHARISVADRRFFRTHWISIPVIYWVLIFLGFQLIGAYAQINGRGGISFLGHIGGLAVGAFAAFGVKYGLLDKLFHRENKFNPRTLDDSNYKLN